MPGMTDRDHFAVAALTGLLARGLLQSNLLAADAYKVADAMLRERCRRDGDCPGSDNAANHDAAPAARAGTPGTGDTDHGASPEAIARTDADRGRTDKADFRPGKGTGDTPAAHATPGEGSVPREGTQEPVAWGVANGSRVLATSISRMDAVDMQGDYAYHTEIVPLYREPTLTDEESDDLRMWFAECMDQSTAATDGANEELSARWLLRAHRAAVMLDRLGGWR